MTPKANSEPSQPADLATKTRPQLANIILALDRYLTDLYESFPPRTAFVIFSGHSDPRRMAALNTRRNAFETSLKVKQAMDDVTESWTSQNVRELEEEVERAKRGLLFVAVKNKDP